MVSSFFRWEFPARFNQAMPSFVLDLQHRGHVENFLRDMKLFQVNVFWCKLLTWMFSNRCCFVSHFEKGSNGVTLPPRIAGSSLAAGLPRIEGGCSLPTWVKDFAQPPLSSRRSIRIYFEESGNFQTLRDECLLAFDHEISKLDAKTRVAALPPIFRNVGLVGFAI